MPKHIHVDTCLREDGPLSKYCTCEHCCLAVCKVCGCYEGSLTTDCAGAIVDFDTQNKIYVDGLDYSEAEGWHIRYVGGRWPSAKFE